MIDTARVDTASDRQAGSASGRQAESASGRQAGPASELAVLGEHVEAHSDEIAQAVLAWWLARHPESKRSSDVRIREDIVRTTGLGARTLGRFLVTGQLPSSKDRNDLARPGSAPLHDTISIGELTKLYLAWRDITCERLAAYASEVGVSKHTLRSAQDIARVGSDSSIVNVIRQFDDAHRRLREQLAHNAVHDGLTGLPNRTLLVDRLDQLVSGPHRRSHFALLFIDIDRFKSVNDLAGHAAGDELLVAVAARLRGVIRQGDTIARLGGDEFVILCPDLADPCTEASAVAERVTAVIGQPFKLGDPQQDFYVSASVGVGLAAPDDTAETILSRADAAMYAAKNRGGSGHQIYDETVDRSIKRRPELLNDLHGATERGEISVHYQPVVDLATGDVSCLEALARWTHPQFGSVPPDEFIPLAEESGVINPLGRWVLARALRDCAAWRRGERPGVGVAVNVSGRQFSDEGLPEFISGILAETGLDPRAVTLEITESVIVTIEMATQQILRDLKATGVRLSIDDFGTGYSSLAYLRCLPIDVLKVDRSFVSGLGEEGKDTAIVTAMVELAHSLKLAVVAEGVETQTELEMVRRAGCDEAQGYLLGRPQPRDADTADRQPGD